MESNVAKTDIGTIFSSFFNTQFESFTPWSVLLAMLFGLAVGLVIAEVYRRTYRGVLYSPSFSLMLIMLTLITAPVVMAISSNVALSMGMVGALSIVRFRTAVKDPLDTAYMFWAITMGILIGAKQFIIALVVVFCISVILLALSYVKRRSAGGYLLVLHYDEYAEDQIDTVLQRATLVNRLRSKTISRAGAEMTVEVRLKNRDDLVSLMLNIEGVHDATLVACATEAGA